MMRRDELVGKLQSIKPALEAEGVRHLSLFGSRSRGDNAENSDVDLLLEVEPERRFSILNLVGVEHLVEDTTGLKANAFMQRALDAPFRTSIRSDLIRIF